MSASETGSRCAFQSFTGTKPGAAPATVNEQRRSESHCVGRGKAGRRHDSHALVSPETGLTMMSANVAVGDWYVAVGSAVHGTNAAASLVPLKRFHLPFPLAGRIGVARLRPWRSEGGVVLGEANRIPVTVLTGFLGSGKTTLLNRILTESHGQRIAVIENEFGEIGVDQELVINAEEEIFEMNNGCICCTVRGDLIRILGNLITRRDKFDRIVLETTGLANPGPVAQTFFVDEGMREEFALDG